MHTTFRAAIAAGAAALLASCTPTTQATGPTTAAAAQRSCGDLMSVSLPHATITEATTLEAGDLQPIDAFGIPPLPTMAGYCRVNATLSPVEG
ncbi:MAG TPA: hypothetical protein VM915_09950, partial [Verrucomicrobiae bacterium]|nr:hypothetical protein [Verrucomicrobiae bacterium]